MLEQIFTKEFLEKTRCRLISVFTVIKYVCFIVGLPCGILLASGVDAPDPAGSNTFKACAFCIGLCVLSMLIEMFTVKFLVKDDEYISCIWDFNWYGLKSEANYKEYKKEMRKLKAEQRRREENFKRMMAITNSFATNNDPNVIQFSEFQNVRYNKPSKEENVRSM